MFTIGSTMPVNDTVTDRFRHAQGTLTMGQLVVGLLLSLAIVFVMVFLQEPLVHDALHHFRHGVGITCM